MTRHPMPETARPCPDCEDGRVVWRTCGHTGNCPCELHDAECETCRGIGAVLCSHCGEGVAVVWDDWRGGRWGYCDEHRDEVQVEITVSPRLSFVRAIRRIIAPRETADEYVARMGRRAS